MFISLLWCCYDKCCWGGGDGCYNYPSKTQDVLVMVIIISEERFYNVFTKILQYLIQCQLFPPDIYNPGPKRIPHYPHTEIKITSLPLTRAQIKAGTIFDLFYRNEYTLEIRNSIHPASSCVQHCSYLAGCCLCITTECHLWPW